MIRIHSNGKAPPSEPTRSASGHTSQPTARVGDGRALPSEAERYMAWYAFINRLPSTYLRLSTLYIGVFLATTIIASIAVDLRGAWLAAYGLAGSLFIGALYVALAGLMIRKA